LGKGQNFVVQKAPRRAEQFWTDASDPLNGFGALLNFLPDLLPVLFGQIGWMGISVIANFVPFSDDSSGNLGELLHALPNQEKGRFDAVTP
jgi:hypothetical protein